MKGENPRYQLKIFLMMMRYANSCSKNGISWRNGKPPPIHNNVYGLHGQKKARIKPNNTCINALVLSIFFILELCKTDT